MSVFEVGTTISESTGGHASAGGNSGAGNRFYFSDDAHAELGLQKGTAYNARIRLQGNTSGFIKLTMIGHRGYAPNAGGNIPFCYIVEALPQNMGTRTALSSTTTSIATRSFENGIEAQHLMGLEAGDFYPTVSCFQYTDYTEITLRVMNQSNTLESSQNRSNVKDTTATDHSAALTKHYAGQSDVTVAGQAGEMGGDAIFFTAYIEGYSYNSTLSEGIFTSHNRFMGGRGIFAGTPASPRRIEYIAIGVLGNAVDFAEMFQARYQAAGASDGSRGIVSGGDGPHDTIEYLAISTLADGKDFGELTVARRNLSGASDGSRGVFSAGYPVINTIDYITIGIIGNALDFGDLTQGRRYVTAVSNGERAVTAGGMSPPRVNTIDHISISVLGNASDFGDRTVSTNAQGGSSDGSRGVYGGGYATAAVDTIDYINIGTIGNAVDFGNRTVSEQQTVGASDGSRGVFAGADPSDVIDYITISTVGNAIDFGNLTAAMGYLAAFSGD